MKEAIASAESSEDNEEKLDMSGVHRVHTLFSGTSIVTVQGQRNSSTNSTAINTSISDAPDGGALAYVLRTGFGSSQGGLLQMIEFSQQSVSGDTRETGLALLLLFVFAIIASGYVLKEGLRKQEKTTHELLLRCVIIITSVVPRQFPMQVNIYHFNNGVVVANSAHVVIHRWLSQSIWR
jgi:manganese-transporting P-type ATPase